jgi:hypothetical protein
LSENHDVPQHILSLLKKMGYEVEDIEVEAVNYPSDEEVTERFVIVVHAFKRKLR